MDEQNDNNHTVEYYSAVHTHALSHMNESQDILSQRSFVQKSTHSLVQFTGNCGRGKTNLW